MSSLIDTNQDDRVQIDPAKDYLKELVGNDKKFKTVEDLARGKYEADAYIEIQNKRMDEIRNDYKELREARMAGKSLEDLIDQYSKIQQQKPSDQNPPEVEQKPAFDMNQIESLVSRKVVERETFNKQEQNFNEVKSKLQEKYGAKSTEILKRQIDDLGLTVEQADGMARNNPRLFYRSFGLDAGTQQESLSSLPRSSTSSFVPTAPKRDYNYYAQIRKENPDLYWSPKTQVQMHEDALQQGDAFGL